MRKKEAQRELKRVKHLTAKQAARKKDNEMWEKNRMIRSGTVTFPLTGLRVFGGQRERTHLDSLSVTETAAANAEPD